MSTPNPAVETIFNAAKALPPESRAEYLNLACKGDPALRHEVERLLAAANEAERFFEANPVGLTHLGKTLMNTPIREGAGTKIGRYKLLQQIGEGGMGVVYMAEQEEPVRRRVALKIIKLGMDSKQVIARFEAERQALAMMDHPNIARVLDGGTTDSGRPYFVMELVQGMSIVEFCDKARLPAKDRIDLFLQVCEAVQSAHQKGIIHRDLKPSNVLVTQHHGKPMPKVIDFGIAKATNQKLTEKTLFTQHATMIGTPAYMSPEQAELTSMDVDTRSDLYSLGVLLYELLTGSTPFPEKRLRSLGYGEMQRVIAEEEPQRPSTRLSTLDHEQKTVVAKNRGEDLAELNTRLRGDLDWIVMKCLEKDRTRRYETANGLAEDLKRHLDNEPVTARPPSGAYRFQKAFRRNRLVFTAVGAISASLVLGIAASLWQAVRAKRAEQTATNALARVSAERDAKEQARKDAEEVSLFLRQVFESPDPNRDGRSLSLAEMLDAAARKLDTDLVAQPALRAKLQMTLASTYHALALSSRAIPLNEAARDFYLATSGAEHPDSLTALANLAASYASNQRGAEALELRGKVLALRRKVLGPEHPDTIGAMSELASSYTAGDRHAEALRIFEEVQTLRRKLLGPEHPDTIGAMQNVAASYAKNGRVDEAIKMFEEALPLRRKVSGPERHETLLAMNALAMCYAGSGRTEEAIKLFNEALPLTRKVFGPEHPNTLAALDQAAMACFGGRRYEEAARLFEEELALSRKVLGLEHANTFMTTMRLASCFSRTGRDPENTRLFADELALSRKALGPGHTSTQRLMTQLILCHYSAGRSDEVIQVYEEDLALSRRLLAPDHPHTLKTMSQLADAYRTQDQTAKADALEMEIATARAKERGERKQP